MRIPGVGSAILPGLLETNSGIIVKIKKFRNANFDNLETLTIYLTISRILGLKGVVSSVLRIRGLTLVVSSNSRVEKYCKRTFARFRWGKNFIRGAISRILGLKGVVWSLLRIWG